MVGKQQTGEAEQRSLNLHLQGELLLILLYIINIAIIVPDYVNTCHKTVAENGDKLCVTLVYGLSTKFCITTSFPVYQRLSQLF